MATETKTEILQRMFDKINVVGLGFNATPEDSRKAGNVFDSTLAEFIRKEYIWWQDQNATPVEAADIMATILAGRCTNEFRLSGQEAQTLKSDHDKALGDLFELQETPVGSTTEAEYF